MEKKVIAKNIISSDSEIKEAVENLKEIISENSKKNKNGNFRFDTNSIQKINFLLSSSERIILENNSLKAESEMFKLVNKSFVDNKEKKNQNVFDQIKDSIKEKFHQIKENNITYKKELKALYKGKNFYTKRIKFLEESLKEYTEKNKRLNLNSKDLRLEKIKKNAENLLLKEKLLEKKSLISKTHQRKYKDTLDKYNDSVQKYKKISKELQELNVDNQEVLKENLDLKKTLSKGTKELELQNISFKSDDSKNDKVISQITARFKRSEDDRMYLADQNSSLKNKNEVLKSEIEVLEMKLYGIEKLNKDLDKEILKLKSSVKDLDKKISTADVIILEQRANLKENKNKITFLEHSLKNINKVTT